MSIRDALIAEVIACHDRFLKEDNFQNQNTIYETMKTYAQEFLSAVSNEDKFGIELTYQIVYDNVMNVNFQPLGASKAFECLAKYTQNLILQPWRKDFYNLKLTSGYFVHNVRAYLDGCVAVFQEMGYKFVENEPLKMFLDLKILNVDVLMKISLDMFIASQECIIIHQIQQKVFDQKPQYSLSAADVFELRKKQVGDVNSFVKFILSDIQQRQITYQKQIRLKSEFVGRQGLEVENEKPDRLQEMADKRVMNSPSRKSSKNSRSNSNPNLLGSDTDSVAVILANTDSKNNHNLNICKYEADTDFHHQLSSSQSHPLMIPKNKNIEDVINRSKPKRHITGGENRNNYEALLFNKNKWDSLSGLNSNENVENGQKNGNNAQKHGNNAQKKNESNFAFGRDYIQNSRIKCFSSNEINPVFVPATTKLYSVACGGTSNIKFNSNQELKFINRDNHSSGDKNNSNTCTTVLNQPQRHVNADDIIGDTAPVPIPTNSLSVSSVLSLPRRIASGIFGGDAPSLWNKGKPKMIVQKQGEERKIVPRSNSPTPNDKTRSRMSVPLQRTKLGPEVEKNFFGGPDHKGNGQ